MDEERPKRTGSPLTPEEIASLREAAELCGYDFTKTARLTGHSRNTVIRHVVRPGSDGGATALEAHDVTPPPAVGREAVAAVEEMIRKGKFTPEDIATTTGLTVNAVDACAENMWNRGDNVRLLGGCYAVVKDLPVGGAMTEYVSRPDGSFVFGVSSDQHLGSKYERLDVLNDLYDKFAAEGVDRVYNAGNWIDGEARFNKFDLHTHGMDSQLRYLVASYPRRQGLTTYAIAGDDHEGWYCQNSGVDIGRRAEQDFREAGRHDFVYLGYVEAHVKLIHAQTGASSVMTVIHPGGGSAYAVSYQPQKLVESLEGGEKPSVMVIGHYHKLSLNNIRNVWVVQSGCTQDQTTFMKKKRIDAHVGGGIITLKMDPRTGAVPRCQPDFLRYFNRGYYQNRWSHSGPVTLPERSLA